jgi:hypothetical protein
LAETVGRVEFMNCEVDLDEEGAELLTLDARRVFKSRVIA